MIGLVNDQRVLSNQHRNRLTGQACIQLNASFSFSLKVSKRLLTKLAARRSLNDLAAEVLHPHCLNQTPVSLCQLTGLIRFNKPLCEFYAGVKSNHFNAILKIKHL